jgi:hypothetical protein
MQALAYWKAVTADRSEFLERLVALLAESGIRYCVVDGQGVNAYVEPVVSLDLDLAVATDDLARAESLLGTHFQVKRFPHSVNVAAPGSNLRVQVQTDPRYAAFVARPRRARSWVSSYPWPRSRPSCRARCGLYRTLGGVRASDRRISPTSRDSWRPTQSCDASFRRPYSRA